MTPSTFPTFLAFPTHKPAPTSERRQGLEIAPGLPRERLGPRPAGDDLKPEPPSEGTRAPVGASRLGAAMSCSISVRRYPVHGRRWLARWRHNKPTAWAGGRPDAGPGTISASNMAVSAGKIPEG
jgi:hypothetical protein